jgi:hypothetical protein
MNDYTATSGAILISPGDIISSHCHVHGQHVPHLYQPSSTPSLLCLLCDPAKDWRLENITK